MVSQKVTINNPQGLHMRPAGVFAKGMAKFDSDQRPHHPAAKPVHTALYLLRPGLQRRQIQPVVDEQQVRG